MPKGNCRAPGEPAESEQFLLAEEESIRRPVEADANKVRGGKRKRGQTRGNWFTGGGPGFLGSPAQQGAPPPAAAVPPVRVRPRGWAKPLAQGAQCLQNTAKHRKTPRNKAKKIGIRTKKGAPIGAPWDRVKADGGITAGP